MPFTKHSLSKVIKYDNKFLGEIPFLEVICRGRVDKIFVEQVEHSFLLLNVLVPKNVKSKVELFQIWAHRFSRKPNLIVTSE